MTEIPATVGEYLRKTREARGISLEQAAQVTRVRLPYLIAIENDEPSGLPSAVQARGFLRLYASFLEIPAQPLLDGWKAGSFTPPSPTDGIPVPTPVIPAPADQTPQPLTISEPEPAEIILPLPPDLVEYSETEDSTEVGSNGNTAVQQRGSDQIFQEIGVILRERRESLHLSVADIERFTRLRGLLHPGTGTGESR